MIGLSPDRPDGPAVEGVGGFLQLCSDRRYHRKVMAAFERATGLASDAYYVEARPGGAASWADKSKMARIAYRNGALFMGWAGHGDRFYATFSGHLARRRYPAEWVR